MGQELAYEAFRLGGDVTIIHRDEIHIGRNIPVTTASSMGDAIRSVMEEEIPDIYISAAAISDFAPECISGKIPSETCNNSPSSLPKLLDLTLGTIPVTVAFKLGQSAHEEAEQLLLKG